MRYLANSAILYGLATSAVVLAGPAKPIDECKDVKKEVQSLQEPKIRKPATAYCSQYLGLEEITETFDVYERSTDFNLPPETYYPWTVITYPPGTVTETDTYTKTILTETLWLTQYYYCTITPCPTDWDKSTLLITANEPTPSTIYRTITQSPNPLPKADPTKLAKACECLSIPLATSTRTDTYTLVYAPYTVTGPTDTYTDYNQVVLEIETVTIDVGISTVTIPDVTYPHFEYTTVYFPWPFIYETSTVYLSSQTPTPKHTKRPNQPTKTRSRTTHMHPSPKPTPPPRRGKNHKGDKGKGGKV